MTAERNTSLWSVTAPNGVSWPLLDQDITVDVVVIGGGFTGASAAYHLASSGVSVALLEARTIGFGGSGRNVGLVNAGLWTPPDAVEEKVGKAVGQRLNEELAKGPGVVFDLIEQHQIRCEAVRNGTLHCAHSPAGLEDLKMRYDQQIKRNAPVKLLSAEETAARTGSKAFFGALWDGRAGTIQPLAYVQGLAQAAFAQGAQIFENSAALDIEEISGTWRIKTKSGSVSASHLIQATNAYGTAGANDNAIIPAHYFQLATAPLSPSILKTLVPAREGCWDTALIMSSFRLDAAGRMIFGALGNLDSFGGGAHKGWARRKMEQLFPQLKGVPFENSWTGRIAMTSTYLPRVERRGETGVSIFGYSGRGISPGTLFGRSAAAWVTGTGTFPVDIVPRQSETLPAAKGFYYETGAALTHLVNARI